MARNLLAGALLLGLMCASAASADGEEAGKRAPEAGPAEPEWKRQLREKLARRVSFEFAETPLSEVLGFLQTMVGVPFVADPAVKAEVRKARVTLKLTDVEIGSALRWVVRLCGLEYRIQDRAIFVTRAASAAEQPSAPAVSARAGTAGEAHGAPPQTRGQERAARVAPAPGPEPEWKKAIRERLARRVTFEFVDTPLDEAIGFVGAMVGAPLILDPKAFGEGREARQRITIKLTDAELGAAFQRILGQAGLEWRLVHHAVLVTRAGAPPVRFGSVELGEDDPEWKKATLARLEGPVSFEFMDTPLDQAVAFLREVGRTNLVLDPRVTPGKAPRVTLNFRNVPLRVALDWIMWLGGLRWELRDGAIFVTGRPEPGERPAAGEKPAPQDEPQGAAPAEKRISLEFVKTPAGEAIDFVRQAAGVNVVVDPACGERLKAPVTFQAENLTLGQALDWVLRLSRLRREIRDGVIFITPAE